MLEVGYKKLALARWLGLAAAAAAIAGTTFVLGKLYTGRGGDAPVRSALMEQPLVALVGGLVLLAGVCLAVWPRRVAALRAWLNPRWVWRERRVEACLLCLSTLASLGVLEVASRALYARQYALPFTFSVEVLIYPPLNYQLRGYRADRPSALLLGGSVLWSAGARAELQEGLPECVVYNMAQTGHSSLDSLNKYAWLLEQGYHFDSVVFCHGINDTRANNAPPDVFKPDYDHYSFYQITNTVFRNKRPVLRALLHSMAFYRVYQLWATLRQTRSFGQRYLHVAYPRADWLQYGGDIRSVASFETNLLEIADLAAGDGAEFIVLYFPYNPALDYWTEDRPGYTDEAMIRMTEQWGLPQHVRAGMIAHNQVLARYHDAYTYVADTMALTDSEDNFVDPCHFSEPALAEFIGIIQKSVRASLTPAAP